MKPLEEVDEFTGEHIHFGTEQFPDWKRVVDYLKQKI
jgi:5'-nucleotidase